MDLHEFFHNEVKPALGCTEPVSVAFCAAVAASHFTGVMESMRLAMSVNIYKNGRDVGIPGTNGLRGNELAAVLGALAGDPSKGLLVLQNVAPADVKKAVAFLEGGHQEVEVLKDVAGVYSEVTLRGGGHETTAVVKGRHDQVWSVTVDGEEVVSPAAQDGASGAGGGDYTEELRAMTIQQLWDAASSIDEELAAFMLQGVEVNMHAADLGMCKHVGMGVGKATLEHVCGKDLACRVRGTAAAAADVRMSGADIPVMSSAGSGNHGLTAILPIAVVARAENKSDREMAEALALSHLVTGFIKAYTGRLTPICGCSVAAGAGAAAGLVRLLGGTPEQAERAASTLLSSLMGMLCDGAKGSCALKVSTASAEAWNAANLVLDGSGIQESQGVVGTDLKTSAMALAEVSAKAFGELDGVLVDLMQARDRASQAR
ncbi:MAG: serine dehydratase subunit alpha family protein [Desulfovibrionaceae bacterium]|jgi:L-cysteine desulfidase|nr:serine dehydratase subunit alpha family protein [Desulfovibrionaceae bacterium]